MLNKIIIAYIRASIPNRETSSLLLRMLLDYSEGNLGGSTEAVDITYDNTASGLASDNVQGAIDELAQGATPASKYIRTFNIGDWTLSGSFYQLSIPVSAHNKGVSPSIQTYETLTGIEHNLITSILVNSIGDVILEVSSVPDNRFVGKSIIQ